MPRSRTTLRHAFSACGVAAMLAFGAYAAFAAPAASSCPSGSGFIPFTCTVGTAGNTYCNTQCQREYGPGSVGECFGSPVGSTGCCLCTI